MRGRFRSAGILWVLVLLLGSALSAGLTVGCGEDEAQAQTVRFQKATEPGSDAFTPATDIRGKKDVKLEIGKGPFGGTGSDLVCDRELLIRSLRARPDRLREWARIAGVEATPEAVAKYIRSLKPSTLTRDTRVTNHTFSDGKAAGYQAILQAGTAVLVDKDGVPRVRCRCGNPLKPEVAVKEAECVGCPANYRPPEPCRPISRCIVVYPDPPPVGGGTETAGNERPTVSFASPELNPGEQPKLFIKGFDPEATLTVVLTGPDGQARRSTGRADALGNAELLLEPATDPGGTYTAVVTNEATGASARASFNLTGDSSGSPGPGEPEGGSTAPASPGGEASDLPECGPGVPTPCREGGTVVP